MVQLFLQNHCTVSLTIAVTAVIYETFSLHSILSWLYDDYFVQGQFEKKYLPLRGMLQNGLENKNFNGKWSVTKLITKAGGVIFFIHSPLYSGS